MYIYWKGNGNHILITIITILLQGSIVLVMNRAKKFKKYEDYLNVVIQVIWTFDIIMM